MIVRPRPSILQLFFVMRGSIVPRIAPHILGFAAWASLVVVIADEWDIDFGAVGVAPFALLGVTLSIYLGFRNNAAYERWWEARRLWGQLVHEVRSLTRAAQAALPAGSDAVRPMLMDLLAFCHVLRGQLRGIDTSSEAQRFLTDGIDLDRASNRPDAVVRGMGRRLAEWRRTGLIEPVDYRILDEHLSTIAAVQAGCERISGTPVPFAYTLLLQRSAYVFCALLPFGVASVANWATPLFTALIAYEFFGLDALSEELEDPFGDAPNDLALDALCRTCEISVFEALGEPAPEPLKPDRYVLT